jgi:hypothetical protein
MEEDSTNADILAILALKIPEYGFFEQGQEGTLEKEI